MHAISSYRGNRLTNTQTYTQAHKHTHRQDRLQYTVSQLASAQYKYVDAYFYTFFLKLVQNYYTHKYLLRRFR